MSYEKERIFTKSIYFKMFQTLNRTRLYISLPLNAIRKLPHPRSEYSQPGPGYVLSTTADNKKRQFDTALKPPYLPINTKVKGRSKIKW